MKLKATIGLFVLLLILGGCSAWENAYERAGSASFSVVSIKGSSALSLIKAMEPEIKPTVRLGDTVQYTFEEDEDVLYSQLLVGEFDIALVQTEMAAKLYNNGAGYQVAAVITGGWMPDLSEGTAYDLAFNIQDEWMQANGTEPLPQASLIVKKEIVVQETEAWEMFLADYQDSIDWINNKQDKAEDLLQKHEVGIPAELVQETLQRCNLQYIDALSARPIVERYLNIFLELSSDSIGGKLPNSDFYIE
jgi:ABC-type nitrate/sulfonate/bicarbonate transport system substrate-binding protein